MRLWILSDLHLDHHSGRVSIEPPDHDVMVCAGDVRGDLIDAIGALETLTDRPTVLTAGNHEFYGFEGKALSTMIKRGHRRAEGTAIHLLENEQVIIDGVRFLGCTLWTDYELLGGAVQSLVIEVARRRISDHRMIKLKTRGKPAKRFNPFDAWDLHKASRKWLELALAVPHEGPTVVVTHHGPHKGSVAPQFADDILSPAFVSHMPDLVEGPNAPDLWVHGHTHVAFDYRAGPCRVICNPMGYAHEYTGAPLDLVIDF